MNNYKNIIDNLLVKLNEASYKNVFKDASFLDLRYLKKANYSINIVTFYKHYEPKTLIEYNDIRLWNINDLKQENLEYVPGCILFKFGYRVISTTIFGDIFVANSMDDEDIIYIASHDEIDDGLNELEIKNKIKIVASSFDNFLTKFVNKELKSSYYDY